MADVVFQVRNPQGEAVGGASVLAAWPDGRYVTGRTDAAGECRLSLYRTDQRMTILAACAGHLALHTALAPHERDPIALELTPAEGVNSALFTRSAGYLPGVEGAIAPRKDGYVHVDNIAINGSLAAPAMRFERGEPLEFLDVYGVETTVRFLVVEGQFSLVEYTEPKAYAGA